MCTPTRIQEQDITSTDFGIPMNTHGPWVIMQPTLPPILMTSTHYCRNIKNKRQYDNRLDFFFFCLLHEYLLSFPPFLNLDYAHVSQSIFSSFLCFFFFFFSL